MAELSCAKHGIKSNQITLPPKRFFFTILPPQKIRKITPIFSASSPQICFTTPPRKNEDHIEGFFVYYLKNCLWLLPLTVTVQLSPNRNCYQLSQTELKFAVVEKCMRHCACTHLQKKNFFGQRGLNHYGGEGGRMIGPTMHYSTMVQIGGACNHIVFCFFFFSNTA